jgi:hypothetical protein
MRRDTVHTKPVIPNKNVSRSIFEPTGTGTASLSRFLKERPNEDLVELCEKYLQNLRKILDEYEELFNKPS